jgi:hypothetical protein
MVSLHYQLKVPYPGNSPILAYAPKVDKKLETLEKYLSLIREL